jgi:hypothetical protein
LRHVARASFCAFAGACAGFAETDVAWEPGPPAVQAASFFCDPERQRWELFAEITGWSLGGRAWLTQDGRYVELHEVPSIGAEPDGSRDTLRARLTIVADWRLVDPGASTAFVCEGPPDVFLEIRGFGDFPPACAARGDAWSAIPGRPDCVPAAF